MADKQYEDLSVESLRLIVQSQMILADLQRNQHRLEELIEDLSDTATESKEGP
jgi:hypothetical protein